MIRPEKMRQAEITVLERDIDNIIKYLGRSGILQFSYNYKKEEKREEQAMESGAELYAANLEKIRNCARFLNIELPSEPDGKTEIPGDAEDKALSAILLPVSSLEREEYEAKLESSRIKDQLAALRGFEKCSKELDEVTGMGDFSFLNIKIGRLEPEKQEELRKNMAGRAIVVPVGDANDGGENDGPQAVVVASSKKGRFSLESELQKQNFKPVSLSQEPSEVPSEMLESLEDRLTALPAVFSRIEGEKERYRSSFGAALCSFYRAYLMAHAISGIKSRLVSTQNAWILTGWLPARAVPRFVDELEKRTGGRVAVSVFEAWEAPSVIMGREKIPVKLKHGPFARSFEPLVFSYGAPIYGAIDPTPFTAFFFTLLFAVMFGDVGQGLVLVILGIFAGNKKINLLKNYRHFAAPLKVIGCASIAAGFVYGSIFSNEEIIHGFVHLMPHKDNMDKIFAFFGCTIAVGVILNSIGLIINIMNKIALHKWESAFFSKNGIAGLAFFWYAISIAVRAVIAQVIFNKSFSFSLIDMIGLLTPIFFIVFGSLIFRIIKREKHILEEGIFAFVMEGIVEILETLSGYISNTVSFLRVGAFALSHAVLSFIIWTMAEKVGEATFGSLWSAIIVIFGNAVIILLEGMIVAIQVTRLQYYEFFSKFFTETGTRFKPFTFKK